MSVELDVDERNRVIGENLRKYRLLKGLTQDELAEGICSVSQLSKAENGKTYIKRTLLRQMAERLGVTVERIETVDALLEELNETLQLARDAFAAENHIKSLEYVREVIEKSEEMGYQSLLVEGLLLECKLLNKQQDYQSVIDKIKDAFDRELPADPAHKMLLLYELGHAYELYGNLNAAYDCYCRADEEFEKLEVKQELRLSVLFNLARCHIFMQNYRSALRYAEKAEKLAAEYSKHLYRLRVSYMRAISLKNLGDDETAEKIYLAALREAQENSFLVDVGLINNNIGQLYQDRGEFGQALAHYNRAIKVYELLNEELYLCESIIHLAEISHLEGELEKTVEHCNRVLSITKKIGINTYREKAKALRLLGRVKSAEGKHEEFVAFLEQVLQIYEEHQVLNEAYDVAVELADSLYQMGEKRSVEMYRKAVEINRRSLDFGMRR